MIVFDKSQVGCQDQPGVLARAMKAKTEQIAGRRQP